MAIYLFRKFKAHRNAKQQQQQQQLGYEQRLSQSSNVELQSRSDRQKSSPFITDSETKAQEQAMTRYRQKLVFGLALPFTVSALDLTVIAPATPFIAADFNELSQLNWIVAAFNLCNAAFIPFWAQIADTFGRYVAIQSSSVIALLGAVLAAAAPTSAFSMLCIGRALQGAGCAGLLIITKMILADKVSLKENAKNNSMFTIFAAIGYGVGPVIGGLLTQASWRYCFVLVIPFNFFGMIATHFLLHKELLGPQTITRTNGNETVEVRPTFKNKLATIDFGGQLLFLFGAGLLVLSLTWAGSYYPWSSIKIIVPLVLAVILLTTFFIWEFLLSPGHLLSHYFPTQKPMIPLNLLISRNCGLLMYINFSTGMAMYAVFYFASLYLVLVSGLGSSEAGRNLVYYIPGLGVGAIVAILACNVILRRTWYPLFLGTICEPLGITLLALAMRQGNLPWMYGMLGLTGFGTGIRFMPGTLHGIGYHRSKISSIVSLMALSQAFGGTIATTFMLNIFNEYLSRRGVSLKTSSSSSSSSSSLDALRNMGPEKAAYFKETAREGIVLAFFALTAFLWLGVVAMIGLGNVRIAKEGERDRLAVGSYVGSWFGKGKEVTVEEV